MKRLRALLLLAAFVTQTAFALAAIEFIKLDATSQRQALEPIIYSFVSRGFKKVPDWVELSIQVRKITLEKGYNYQSIETVAEEAAIRLGMTR